MFLEAVTNVLYKQIKVIDMQIHASDSQSGLMMDTPSDGWIK